MQVGTPESLMKLVEGPEVKLGKISFEIEEWGLSEKGVNFYGPLSANIE